MIKSAAGAGSYLIANANRRVDLTSWYDGIIDGAGLTRHDPRLLFRRVMFNMARKHAGQALRRRDTREHVGLYLTAFNAWVTGAPITQLRFTPRDTVPPIAQVT
jgi:hypothetical protein